ncbi:hypothetical protein CsSME_00022547 [Camellia sinensis var. sinensis]
MCLISKRIAQRFIACKENQHGRINMTILPWLGKLLVLI